MESTDGWAMMNSPEIDAADVAGIEVERIRDYADEALGALDSLEGIRGGLLDLADPRIMPEMPAQAREQLLRLAEALTDVNEAVSSPLNGIGYMLDEVLGDEAV
jgi:hypothetical protein